MTFGASRCTQDAGPCSERPHSDRQSHRYVCAGKSGTAILRLMARGSTRLGLMEAVKHLDDATAARLEWLNRRKASRARPVRLLAAWSSGSLRCTPLGWVRLARALHSHPDNLMAAIAVGLGPRVPVSYRQCRLKDVTQHLGPNDRRFVLHQIQDLRSADRGTTMIEALEREPRLSALTWLDLILEFDATSDSAQALRRWGVRHQLEGPETPCHSVVGRVAEKHKFSEDFIRYSPLGPLEARAALENLFDAFTFDSERRKRGARLLSIGGSPMWCTFSLAAGEGPFDFCAKDHNRGLAVRTSLGLETRGARARTARTLLLMEYDLPNGIGHCPTVGDAAKYDPWNYYFSPAEPGEKHGWTKPWDRGGPGTRGRPELVHRPATVADLTRAMEQLA